MKFVNSKRIVFRNLQYRVFAVLIFAASLFCVGFWNNYDEQITGRFLVQLQPERETIIQNRNLSSYDYGGRIASCFYDFEIPPELCEALRTQSRNFILDLWKSKKRGYVILEFAGIDNFSEYYIFVEPDQNGKWQIIWRQEYSDRDRGFAKNISNSVATDVKRQFSDADNYSFNRGYEILVFIDDEGNETARF